MIDPITGLPTTGDPAINDPYLYQIPLTTNPIQAPEWGWRGHVDQVLYPDHIPSIFATAQGYDESNPGAAQAHHMDGDGNLYVNVRKNEASGGGSSASKPKYDLVETNWAGFGDLHYPFIHNVQTIYSIVGFIHSWRDDNRASQELSISIGGPTIADNLVIAQAYGLYHDMGYPPNEIMFPFNQQFPNGLDMSGMFSTTVGLTLDVLGGSSFWGSFWISILYSD